jgi:hypothetical protein
MSNVRDVKKICILDQKSIFQTHVKSKMKKCEFKIKKFHVSLKNYYKNYLLNPIIISEAKLSFKRIFKGYVFLFPTPIFSIFFFKS